MTDWADDATAALLMVIERNILSNDSGFDWANPDEVQTVIAAALRKAKADGMWEAAKIAQSCFGPADEALSVGEGQGYDLAMDRIETAIIAAAQAIEDGK